MKRSDLIQATYFTDFLSQLRINPNTIKVDLLQAVNSNLTKIFNSKGSILSKKLAALVASNSVFFYIPSVGSSKNKIITNMSMYRAQDYKKALIIDKRVSKGILFDSTGVIETIYGIEYYHNTVPNKLDKEYTQIDLQYEDYN